MPILKMIISGQEVDSIAISFHGLEQSERFAHVEGLTAWLKKRNLTDGQPYEVYIDHACSKVDRILKEEAMQERVADLHERVFSRSRGARTGYKHPVKLRKPEGEPEPAKIQRVKGEYSNKRDWD